MFVSATAAFRERLLELVPIYYDAGRAIAALTPPSSGPTAADLAVVACRRWLVAAIPAGADAMAPVISALSDEPAALIAFARDVAALAHALDDGALATTAGYAQATALAAAAGRDADAGRAGADCLYSRRSPGTDCLVAEARALLAAGPSRTPDRPSPPTGDRSDG